MEVVLFIKILKILNFNIYYNDSSQKDLRLTIDQPEDYETVINILSKVKTNFFIDDILKIVKNNPEFITNSYDQAEDSKRRLK